MNFFLDENFPKSAEIYLTSSGHKVHAVRSSKIEGLDDHSVFKLVQEKESIFLTTDKDFFHTVPLQFSSHCGILIITLRLPNRQKILEKLEWALENIDLQNMSNKVILLRDKSYTIK